MTAFDLASSAEAVQERDLPERFAGITARVRRPARRSRSRMTRSTPCCRWACSSTSRIPDASLDEIRRVLVPGGTFYCYKLPNRQSYLEAIAPPAGDVPPRPGAEFDLLYDVPVRAATSSPRTGFDVLEARLANMLPARRSPGGPPTCCAGTIWHTSNGLARVPGVNRLATNVELVARARPGSSASSSGS